MKTTPIFPKTLALAAISLSVMIISTGPTGAVLVQNGSFESPIWNTQGSAYGYLTGADSPHSNPFTISNWTYGFNASIGGGAGVAPQGFAGGAGWDNTRPVPDGSQFAFVQVQGAFVSQDLSLTAGDYSLSFWIAPRSGTVSQGTADYQVLLNATALVSGSTVGGENPFTQVTTSFSVPSAGTYTLKFLNTTSTIGDNTFLLDNVVVVPEPSTMTLLACGGLLWLRLRNSTRD